MGKVGNGSIPYVTDWEISETVSFRALLIGKVSTRINNLPTNKEEPNKNNRLTFWTRLRDCPYENELVLATQIRNSNVQAESK